MNRLILSCATVALLAACDFLNFTNINDNRTGGSTDPSSPCASLVDSINVDVEGGLTAGQGKVNVPILFSAAPLDAAGNLIPSACQTGSVQSEARGDCAIQGAPTLSSIAAVSPVAGSCGVHVCFAGKCGDSDIVAVVP